MTSFVRPIYLIILVVPGRVLPSCFERKRKTVVANSVRAVRHCGGGYEFTVLSAVLLDRRSEFFSIMGTSGPGDADGQTCQQAILLFYSYQRWQRPFI